jgi:hypothetical protein
MAGRDPHNNYAPVAANDKGSELVDLVIAWYRSNRNVLTAAQQTAVITAITNVLSGSAKV